MDQQTAVYKIIFSGIWPIVSYKFPDKKPLDQAFKLQLYNGLSCFLSSFPKVRELVVERNTNLLVEHMVVAADPSTSWAVEPSPIIRNLIFSKCPLFSPDLFKVNQENGERLWDLLKALLTFID